MRPTRLGIVLTGLGFVFALLPALAGEKLWTFWLVFCGLIVLAYGLDFVLRPRRRHVTATLEAPDVLYIGETGEATLTLSFRSENSQRFEAAIDLSETLELQPVARGI